MRVVRSLMLVFGIAMAAGGCSQQPVLRYQMAAAPQGIDNVIYGSPAAPAYRAIAAPSYAAQPYVAPTYAAQSYATPTYAAPTYATPSYATAAPSYGLAAAPAYATAPVATVGGYPGYAGGVAMAQPQQQAPLSPLTLCRRR